MTLNGNAVIILWSAVRHRIIPYCNLIFSVKPPLFNWNKKHVFDKMEIFRESSFGFFFFLNLFDVCPAWLLLNGRLQTGWRRLRFTDVFSLFYGLAIYFFLLWLTESEDEKSFVLKNVKHRWDPSDTWNLCNQFSVFTHVRKQK